MTYHNRMPMGAIGGSDAPTTPPRFVPGRSAGAPVKPLDCRPLSEADAWPALPMPRVVYRPQRHSRLYWLAWDAWWGVVGHLDSLRSDWGWVGEVALMVLCAVALVLGVAVGMLALLAAGLR